MAKLPGQVFVAGGTGRLGARVIRELLVQGFNVRAGTRNVARAQGFVDTAASFGLLPNNAARRIKVVDMDLTDVDSIAAAIGNAGKVSSIHTNHSIPIRPPDMRLLKKADCWSRVATPCCMYLG